MSEVWNWTAEQMYRIMAACTVPPTAANFLESKIAGRELYYKQMSFVYL